jgi:integrase
MATLSALVRGLDGELRRLGYEDATMVWYRRCWRRMQEHFAARGVEEFSLGAAMAWVDDACGFIGKEQAGTLRPHDIYLFRVAAMLGEYAAHGAVLRRYNRSVSKLDGTGAEAVGRFRAQLRSAGRSASTVRTYGTLAGEFVAFAGTRGGLACCDASTIAAFVATLAGYQAKTVEQKLCAVRSFLRFASAAGLVDGACVEAVPAARSAMQARVPSVWDPGEVASIVDAIDRDNPCGKRDYAIILLITMLGLRGVDIRRLEFADFDWPGNRLFVMQAKTGHRVQLPLLKGRRPGARRRRHQPARPAAQQGHALRGRRAAALHPRHPRTRRAGHHRYLRSRLHRGRTQSPRSRLRHGHRRPARMEPRPRAAQLARQPVSPA